MTYARHVRQDTTASNDTSVATRWKKRAVVCGVYLLTAFAVTAPAWLGSGLLVGGGDQPDWNGTAWAYWWTGHALQNGQNPFNSTWNFLPVGQNPLSQYNLLDAFLFWPLIAIFGPRLGYNFAAVATLWSTGCGGHVFARTIGSSRTTALFAGIALETSTYCLLEISHGRLSQALLVFWLLGLSGLLRIMDGRSSWRMAAATGVSVAAVHLTYWYYGLFLTLTAIPLWLSEFWFWDRRRWGQMVLAASVTIALCLPAVWLLAANYANLPGVVRELEPWMEQYGDLGRGEFGLSMAINQSHWPLWPLLHTANDPEDKRVALALLGLLTAAGLTRGLYRSKRWMVVAAVGWLLTLGPYVKWTALVPMRLSLPYLWLYDQLPFFSRFWWPQRLELIFLVGAVALSVLLLERLGRMFPLYRKGIVLAAIGLLLLDKPFRNKCFPIEGLPPRDFDERLYSVVNGPILTTPVLSTNEITRHLLWLQMFHKQPILAGLGDHIPAHRPAGFEDTVRSYRVLAALETLSQGNFPGTTVTSADVDALMAAGFQYAVVDPAAYSPGLEGQWAAAYTTFFRSIWGEPMMSSGGGRVWRISRVPGTIQIPAIDAVEITGPRVHNGRATPGDGSP